ncbi:MAG: undecaprenyl-diphosphate phosphatase, partial [Deltaproteobacteria bacterium]|nr:undecaprenyl-diphosphate phosphatase [Deltaproteobacteria bacterium]
MITTEAIFLGILQGVTEFLPVSSSGHLVLAEYFLGLKDTSIAFD